MKTSAVSVTRGLLVFLVLAAAVDARGQVGQIYELTNYPKCDTSIIREWKEGLSLIYSRQPGSGNWFHLANSLGMTVASVKVGTDVKDMEIVDDTVYYCCMEPGSMYIGYFTIPDLLSPGQD